VVGSFRNALELISILDKSQDRWVRLDFIEGLTMDTFLKEKQSWKNSKEAWDYLIRCLLQLPNRGAEIVDMVRYVMPASKASCEQRDSLNPPPPEK
jgi:hypothetical protein